MYRETAELGFAVSPNCPEASHFSNLLQIPPNTVGIGDGERPTYVMGSRGCAVAES
jgi:hypothetical protein